ncbi:MAG: HRDC domain-containing protein, partial [Sciscionella sp.]
MSDAQESGTDDNRAAAPTEQTRPLKAPVDGVPDVVAEHAALRAAAAALAVGHGPVAIDTERASGYRYSQRAYLVQLRRCGAGSFLIDPIALHGDVHALAQAINDTEWVLHAATQDLPCLAELGLHPATLFDTELAGRLAGFDRVALGTMTAVVLGYALEKGHGAADWSRRPLPADWLNYAALDVELLIELRAALRTELMRQGKLDWAMAEFEAIRTAPPKPPRTEPWRRTSGIHKIRQPRQLAAVRALWEAREELAKRRDIAPGRVLPDRAIVDAAVNDPPTITELMALAVFRGRSQRRIAATWFDALRRARVLPKSELPSSTQHTDGPPSPSRWDE